MEPQADPSIRDGDSPRIAYLMSRFPKLTETFVLYEMEAVEASGATIRLYPLRLARDGKMHRDAARWVDRAQRGPLLSGAIVASGLVMLARRPLRTIRTLALLLWHTRGSRRYFAGALAFFPKAIDFARRMERDRVQHVHAHFASHPAAVAWVIHRLSGIPYSFTAHGSDLHRDRAMLAAKVADAAFVVAISQFNRQVILDEVGPEAAGKVVVIHCGVDLGRFRPAAGAGGHAHQNGDGPAALTPPVPDILCVGTLHEVKGQRVLIEACARLAARGIPFTCTLIGDGPDRRDLMQHAERSRIADRVRFVGTLTQDDVRARLHRADLVAAPSVPSRDGRREGIPVALMEAMASGVPVIASRLSGIPELVRDGESGLLVEPGDVEGLAAGIERLLRDRALRSTLGVAGRAKVEREFDLRRNASALLQRFKGTVVR